MVELRARRARDASSVVAIEDGEEEQLTACSAAHLAQLHAILHRATPTTPKCHAELQPRVEGLSKLSRFRHYTNLDRTLPRLEQLLGEFDFATARTTLERLKLLPREPLTQRIEIH